MTIDRARLAALRLATLAPRDRRWLVGRLPAPLRARIEAELPMAMQLQAAEPLQCSEWVSQIAASLLPGVPVGRERDVEILEAATPEQVAAVLDELPEALRRFVVAARPWRWRMAYLDRQSEAGRQALMSAAGASPKPAAARALFGALARAIDSGARGASFDSWIGRNAPASG